MSSYMDEILVDDGFEAADYDDFTAGFRDRYGSHRIGHFEEDPEMMEYEEMLALGESLGGYND